MARFKPVESESGFFLSLIPSEQFEEDSIEKLVYRYVEEKVHYEEFEKNYDNEDKGQRAIHPKVMLKVIFYSYIKGIQSLRKMEEMTRQNLAYIYFTGNKVIDHTTIAKFLNKHREAVINIFSELLIVMNELGMIDWSHIVIDGTRISGNAFKGLTGNKRRFEENLKQYKELSKKLVLRSERLEKEELRDEEKERERDRIDRQRKKYENVIKKIEEYHKEVEEGKIDGNKQINLTDRESSLLKTEGGFVQGYNVQTAISNNDVIVSIEARSENTDQSLLEEMVNKVEEKKQEIKVDKKSEYSLDKGYFDSEKIVNLDKEGISVYIPIPNSVRGTELREGMKFEKDGDDVWLILENQKRIKGKKYGKMKGAKYYFKWREDGKKKVIVIRAVFIDEMEVWEKFRRKMESEEGKMKYNKRIGKEHNFDTLKNSRGLRRIMRRGREKATLEAVLSAIGHNLCKLLSFKVENKLSWAEI